METAGSGVAYAVCGNRLDGRSCAEPDLAVEIGFLPGQMIGRYRVVRELGGGGFGKVYLCWDATLEQSRAVKTPRRPDLAVAAADAWLSEARTVA